MERSGAPGGGRAGKDRAIKPVSAAASSQRSSRRRQDWGGLAPAGRSAGFFILSTDSTMNQKLSLHKILAAAVLFSFCSCASPSQGKRVADGRPSAGAQIGKSAVNGLRYLVGAPFFLGVAVFGPIGGAPPSVGLQMLQDLHDYELPDGSPKPTNYIELPPK